MADGTAEIFAGGLFDQERIVNQAEGLQDFRRRQEGHLIIADDRPLLVMSFGTKYAGANPAKYKIEGKFDIPVGYKVIIKWDEDEVVFMTRQGTFGPEFQIVYLPKSPIPEDFTMFEWNANIAEIWDQFLTVIEGHEDRDMRLFHQGPWRAFGVTRDEVQIALKQGTDNKTIVDGILYCADGQNPTIMEYKRYLQGEKAAEESDEEMVNYVWLLREFMTEPLPPGYLQCVREGGMVCWAEAHTQETTWKHPHYDKYRKMLAVARNQKPVAHWKSIAAFRIEFLLSSIFTWEVEATGDYPIVETVENVTEIARIFGIDIQNEPYLVHVLKRALRHYGHAVREKRPVKDVEDFLNLMQRYRDMVGQFEQMREEEAKRIQKMKVCVQCDERDAVLFCDQCKDFFCQGCFDRLHNKGRRQHHRRSWVEMGVCAECQESAALFHCVQCADLYCRDCYQEWHVRGGRRNHIPIVLRSFNSQAHVLPDATPAMGTGSAKVLAQARSPWFTFVDENNVKLYYNIHDGTSRRDMPLATINEPIEEDKGGGLSSGWAGTWGSSMFPDPLPDDHKKTNDMETTF
jgi:hypothetical protein|mmetsp:Transcript_735/g.2361  ORF Transcript_735/g.2361 Transcript_735/m.2361 type:complete len:573 (-) Transcript_735:120-1838(-)